MLGANMVLALNQAARIVPSRDMAEPNVARQGAKERNSVSNEHGHASDNETLNEPRAQEALNGNPTVDIDLGDTTGSRLRNHVRRSPSHQFNDASGDRGEVDSG